ncbi:transcription repressor OFP1-like [Curcuma longa]|uniref:transcription repressor OFP1-like n=1 Tax=Curcuma longa TaxID=136217 RepID=UPI003D9EEC2A
MGNYRFRLSSMMPNAWFYKLKDMSHIANRSKKHRGAAAAEPPPPPAKLLPGRASLYYSSRAEAERFSFSPTKSKALADRFEELPRKSKRGSRKKPPAARPRLVASAAPELAPPETPRKDLDFASGESDPCCCRVISSATDIIIDLGAGDSVELNLRPVATKPVVQGDTYSVGSDKRQEQRRPSLSSSPGGSHRLRVRANSPRLAHRSRAARRQKKALPESALAVVKTSSDPQRDFRDSMMEMIVEHNIRASTDLEELLACYLSLNSNEYHDLIVKVFKQIWFDLN